MVMETYYRKRYKNPAAAALSIQQQQQQQMANQSPLLVPHHHDVVPPPPMQQQDYFKVGSMYEIDHLHLPPRTPVQLKSIRIAMVCEKTELSVAIRFPSMGSLRAFFSYSTRATHPALDEKFVMGSVLASKVLVRVVSMETFSQQKNFESFWLISPSSFGCVNVVNDDQNGRGLTDQLKTNGMVRWGIRRQVKYLGRHKDQTSGGGGDTVMSDDGTDNGTRDTPNSSYNMSFEDLQTELMGAFDHKEESQNVEELDEIIGHVYGDQEKDVKEEEEEDEEEEEEEEEDEDEQDEEVEDEEEEEVEEKKVDLKRKRYDFRKNIRNVKKPVKKERVEVKKPYKKVKLEVIKKPKPRQKLRQNKNQTAKTKNKNKSKARFKDAIVLRNPKDRWSSERYKLAEQNLLEVMKAKGATTDNPILRPQLREEARKKIGDTGLLDHLLKHMAGKLAPGGHDRFRRRHNADGAMEYWLESPDLVKIRMDAGVTDPFWVPPPGWQLGDSPTQDPICARELKLLKDDMSKMKRDHLDLMAAKVQLEEEVGKLRRELNELASERKKEENQATMVTSSPSGVSQNLGQIATSLMVSSKSDLEKSPVPLEQMVLISDFVKDMEEKIGTLKSNMEQTSRLDSALISPTQSTAKEKQALIAAPKAKESENTAAAEKAAKIERLKSGFRICKPQGTFLWPNMVKDSYNLNNSAGSNKIMVQTPPSVSSSTALAPPHLPFHRPLESPVQPLAERRALTVTVPSLSQSPSFEDGAMSFSTASALISPNVRPLVQVSPTSRAMMGYGAMQQSTCCSSSSASSGLHCEVGNWLALSSLKSPASDESRHG